MNVNPASDASNLHIFFYQSFLEIGKYTTYTSVVLGKLARGVSTEVLTSNVARKNLGP